MAPADVAASGTTRTRTASASLYSNTSPVFLSCYLSFFFAMGYFDPLLPKIDAAVRDRSLRPRDTLARLDTLQVEAAELAISSNGAPHYEEANTTPGLPDLLYTVWQTLLDLAQKDDGEHERLLALVKEIKADTREPGWTCCKEPASWARMSLFGMVVRDKLNGARLLRAV